MSTSGVSSTNGSSSTTNTTSITSASSALGKDAFLNLLVTEMKNQDPLSPMDNTQYIAQLAQFSSLEQEQSINSSVQSLTQNAPLLEGASMIGKTVSATDPTTGDVINGTVNSIKFSSSGTTINVNNQDINLSYVTSMK